MSKASNSATPDQTLSVSQLNRRVKTLLESQFDYLWVTGEISNFVRPSSGHWYFTLKDNQAQVRCAMFRNSNSRMRFTPANGDAVRLRGRVSLYEGRGDFQLIAEFVEPAGAGVLQARFEALREKLLAEGLFDQERKQPLPDLVRHIGVITSATGAALHDILTVLHRRCPLIEVSVLPVAVQGEGAAGEICAAIARANRWQSAGALALDVLIVGRGGGSLEDLWAFNEEAVARAIAASALPIVSAVGHEVDVSIADMVADQRAPTPSAAAELLSPDQQVWLRQLAQLEVALAARVRRAIADAAREAGHLRARLKHPGTALRERSQRLDDLEQRLRRTQLQRLQREQAQLQATAQRLQAASPLRRLSDHAHALQGHRRTLQLAVTRRLAEKSARVAALAQLLQSLSPLQILQRGYAIISDTQGAVIRDASAVSAGDTLRARLASGELEVEVTGTSGEVPARR